MDKNQKKQFLTDHSPLYLQSPDRIRRTKVIKPLLDALKKKGCEILRLHGPDLSAHSLEELSLQSLSQSLFGSGTKCFTVANSEEIRAELLERVILFSRNARESNHYIVFSAERKPKSDKLLKWLKKEGIVLDYSTPEKKELLAYGRAWCAEQGIDDIPPAALEELAELSQGDLDRLSMYIEQLALYLSGEKIHSKTLSQLFISHTSSSEFQLFEHATNRQYLATVRLLDSLIEEGKNPYALSSLLQRSMLEATEAPMYGAQSVASEMKIQPWRANKVLGAAKKIKRRDVWRMLLSLIRTEERLKGKSLGAPFELQRLSESFALRDKLPQ